MKFVLIDKITELVPGEQIKGYKNLTLSEEYLADHFPGFPVMPGVLMLEAMIQLSSWLIRVTDDFSDSIIYLKEARNVKYGHFVQPGETLELEAKILKREGNQTKLAVQGKLNGEISLSARLTMEQRGIVSDKDDEKTRFKNQQIIKALKEQLSLLLDK